MITLIKGYCFKYSVLPYGVRKARLSRKPYVFHITKDTKGIGKPISRITGQAFRVMANHQKISLFVVKTSHVNRIKRFGQSPVLSRMACSRGKLRILKEAYQHKDKDEGITYFGSIMKNRKE